MKSTLFYLSMFLFVVGALGILRAVLELTSRFSDYRWVRVGFAVAVVAGVSGTAIMLLARTIK